MAGPSIAQPQIGAPSLAQATGKSAATHGKSAPANGFGHNATSQVVSTSTTSNPDGSTTVVTVYANGSKSVTTTAATAPRQAPQLLGDASMKAALAAQEQSYRTRAAG